MPRKLVTALLLLALAGCAVEAPHHPARLTVNRDGSIRFPACPDWSRTPGVDHSNAVSSNFGCANAVDLGLMVADPADLVRGRALGAADGEAAAASIARYHSRQTVPLIEPVQPK